jgi:hypothetical protein
MDYAIQIQRDPSTELVLGLAESMQTMAVYEEGDRQIRRSILLFALKNKLLKNCADRRCVGMMVGKSPYGGWRFQLSRDGVQQTARQHGWFIVLREFSIWKICYSKGMWHYFNGEVKRTPYQFVSELKEYCNVTIGSVLYLDYIREVKAGQCDLFPISALAASGEANPSAVLAPLGMLRRAVDDETLGLARLIFAIKLLANYQQKRNEKNQSHK